MDTVKNGRLKLKEMKQRVVDENYTAYTHYKLLFSRDSNVILSKSRDRVGRGNLLDQEGCVTNVY